MKKRKIDESHISLRKVNYEGIEELWWVTIDQKAFSSPLRDWKNDKDIFLSYVKEKKLLVQAGGNCGMYARFYGNYFDKIYTFEPNPNNFKCLQLNCTEEKYIIHNVGLGKEDGNADLMHPSGLKRRNMGVWQTVENADGDVTLITIDSLNLERCDLIHLDIEGFESNALIGAKQTIEKYKPIIILEAGHGSEVAESYGYEIVYKGTSDWIMIHEESK